MNNLLILDLGPETRLVGVLTGCLLHLPWNTKQAHPPYLDLWLGLGSSQKRLYSLSQAASW